MRLLVNILILAMLTCLIGGGLWRYFDKQNQITMVSQVRQVITEIEHQGTFYGELGVVETSDMGYPRQFDDAWFDDRFPVNILAGSNRPWIDVADDLDQSLHPSDPVITSSKQAGFWYNPTFGIVRARVPAQLTEAGTLALYNQVNGSEMSSLPRYQTLVVEDDINNDGYDIPASKEQNPLNTPNSTADNHAIDDSEYQHQARQINQTKPEEPMFLAKPGQRAAASK